MLQIKSPKTYLNIDQVASLSKALLDSTQMGDLLAWLDGYEQQNPYSAWI
jgi:hypothetical protein